MTYVYPVLSNLIRRSGFGPGENTSLTDGVSASHQR
jgi:hypothetical protein